MASAEQEIEYLRRAFPDPYQRMTWLLGAAQARFRGLARALDETRVVMDELRDTVNAAIPEADNAA